MSAFRKNSHFTQNTPTPQHQDRLPLPPIAHEGAARPVQVPRHERLIPRRTLEDWIARLRTCADEAQDEQLGPLESDILDVREEIQSYI